MQEAGSIRDVFVSYSSHDRVVADAVVHRLEAHGLRCWIAPRDILGGQPYATALLRGISNARTMVVVVSRHSNNSEHVPKEVERAVSAGKPIVPLRIEDTELSPELTYFLSSRHWLDAIGGSIDSHLDRLAASIRALLQVEEDDRSSPSPPSISAEDLRSAGPNRLLLAIAGGLVLAGLAIVTIWWPGDWEAGAKTRGVPTTESGQGSESPDPIPHPQPADATHEPSGVSHSPPPEPQVDRPIPPSLDQARKTRVIETLDHLGKRLEQLEAVPERGGVSTDGSQRPGTATFDIRARHRALTRDIQSASESPVVEDIETRVEDLERDVDTRTQEWKGGRQEQLDVLTISANRWESVPGIDIGPSRASLMSDLHFGLESFRFALRMPDLRAIVRHSEQVSHSLRELDRAWDSTIERKVAQLTERLANVPEHQPLSALKRSAVEKLGGVTTEQEKPTRPNRAFELLQVCEPLVAALEKKRGELESAWTERDAFMRLRTTFDPAGRRRVVESLMTRAGQVASEAEQQLETGDVGAAATSWRMARTYVTRAATLPVSTQPLPIAVSFAEDTTGEMREWFLEAMAGDNGLEVVAEFRAAAVLRIEFREDSTSGWNGPAYVSRGQLEASIVWKDLELAEVRARLHADRPPSAQLADAAAARRNATTKALSQLRNDDRVLAQFVHFLRSL